MRPEKQAVIITGGSSGIGRTTARALVEAGHRIALVGRTPEHVAAAVAELEAAGYVDVAGLVLDVRREEDMAAMVQETQCRFGRVDALVHCAGISRSPAGTRGLPQAMVQLAPDSWRDVLATNLTGVFLANRAVLPQMLSQKYGIIINMSSSPAGISGQPLAAAYSASKAAVAGFSESLAAEVASHGVRVYALFPDLVDTSLTRNTTLQHRFGLPLAPGRVAGIILYLLQLPPDTTLPARRGLGYPVLRRLPQDVESWIR